MVIQGIGRIHLVAIGLKLLIYPAQHLARIALASGAARDGHDTHDWILPI
jgi:hypothetical protein